MPRLTISKPAATGILAGETFNPLAGWQYEYLPWPATVRVMLQSTAVGLVMTVFSGSETIQQESAIDGTGTAAKLPTPFTVDPLGFRAPGGDRLALNIRNTSAGTLPIYGVIDVNPA